MLEINASHFVGKLVGLTLKEWSATKALHVRLGVECSFEGEEMSACVNLLINASSNYKTVWAHTSYGSKFGPRIKDIEWGRDICHHDSVWRDSVDQVFNTTYFCLSDKMDAALGKKVRPADLHFFNTILNCDETKFSKSYRKEDHRSAYYVSTLCNVEYSPLEGCAPCTVFFR